MENEGYMYCATEVDRKLLDEAALDLTEVERSGHNAILQRNILAGDSMRFALTKFKTTCFHE